MHVCLRIFIYSHWLPAYISKYCFKTWLFSWPSICRLCPQLCCCYSSLLRTYTRMDRNASSWCSHFPNQMLLLTHTNSLLDWSAGLPNIYVLVCSDPNFWAVMRSVCYLSSYTSPSRPYLPQNQGVLKQACWKSGNGWGTKEKEPPD